MWSGTRLHISFIVLPSVEKFVPSGQGCSGLKLTGCLFLAQVTRLLKCGNHRVFGKDLEHHLADLEHTLSWLKTLMWLSRAVCCVYLLPWFCAGLLENEGWMEEEDDKTAKQYLYEGVCWLLYSSSGKGREKELTSHPSFLPHNVMESY